MPASPTGNMQKGPDGSLVEPNSSTGQMTGGRRGVSVKALKRTLKAAGKKTSGKKATLRARVKKFRLSV